jgi:hypothetical protein
VAGGRGCHRGDRCCVDLLRLRVGLLNPTGGGGGPNIGVGTNVGAPINLADCTDWNQAHVEERLGTIEELEEFAGGPVVGGSPSDPSGTGAVLDAEQAYELLNRSCAAEFARGFRLYKIYVRAAAFSGQAP